MKSNRAPIATPRAIPIDTLSPISSDQDPYAAPKATPRAAPIPIPCSVWLLTDASLVSFMKPPFLSTVGFYSSTPSSPAAPTAGGCLPEPNTEQGLTWSRKHSFKGRITQVRPRVLYSTPRSTNKNGPEGPFLFVVEPAGIEPASASLPKTVLHT